MNANLNINANFNVKLKTSENQLNTMRCPLLK